MPTGQTSGVVPVPPPTPTSATSAPIPLSMHRICAAGNRMPCAITCRTSCHWAHSHRACSVSTWHRNAPLSPELLSGHCCPAFWTSLLITGLSSGMRKLVAAVWTNAIPAWPGGQRAAQATAAAPAIRRRSSSVTTWHCHHLLSRSRYVDYSFPRDGRRDTVADVHNNPASRTPVLLASPIRTL